MTTLDELRERARVDWPKPIPFPTVTLHVEGYRPPTFSWLYGPAPVPEKRRCPSCGEPQGVGVALLRNYLLAGAGKCPWCRRTETDVLPADESACCPDGSCETCRAA